MNFRYAASVAAIAAATIGVTATAQSVPPTVTATEAPRAGDDDNKLGEITVTARRVSEKLQDVPVSITVLSGNDLRQQNVRTAVDFVRSTPNLYVSEPIANPSALFLSVRGQVQNDILSTLDASIGVYVDGVNYARAVGISGGLLDIDRVEILKGPQGTLFGRNTTGGAFNITTNPVDLSDVHASIRGAFGSYNRFDEEAMINVPIVSDKLGIRLAEENLSDQGFGHDLTSGRRIATTDNFTLRAKVRWKPTDAIDIVGSYEHFGFLQAKPVIHPTYVSPTTSFPVGNGLTFVLPPTPEILAALSTGGCFSQTFGCPGTTTYVPGSRTFASYITNDPYSSYNDAGFPLNSANTDTASINAVWDSPIGALRYIGAYRHVFNQNISSDLDGTPFPVLETTTFQQSHSWSHELQLAGKTLHGALDYTLGVFSFEESGSDGSNTFALSFLNPTNPSRTFGIVDNKSRAGYGQLTYHVSDALSVTGGLRYSEDIKRLDTRNTSSGTAVCVVPISLRNNPNVPCSAILSRQDNSVSYTASANYKVSPDILLYAKTSRGFRAGGQNLRGTDLLSYSPFRPETVTDYELGAKSEFFNRRVRLNAAAFYSDYKDIQRSTLVSNGSGGVSTIIGNAAKARIEGGELELVVLPVSGLQVSGTLGITDPKYTSFPATCNIGGAFVACDRSRENFEQVPKTTWTLSGQYRLPTSFGSVTARADYRYVSAITLSAIAATQSPALVPLVTQTGYGLLSARVGVEIEQMHSTVSFFGTNLTDKRYNIGALDLVNAGLGYIATQAGRPREFGLEVTVHL